MPARTEVRDLDDGGVVDLPSTGPTDIDPLDWLAEDTGPTTGTYTLPDGRTMLIAPITDAEEQQIQRSSRKPDPRDPRKMVREFNVYKRTFIATSINKAHNRKMGEPGYITPDQLAKKNVGELADLMRAIMELSGLDTKAETGTQSFFD